MNIHFSGHHVALTEPLKKYADEKLSGLSKHFNQIIDMHVNLKIENSTHIAEARAQVQGQVLFAAVSAADMYAAIDQLKDKLDRQVRKHKEKRKSHHSKEVTHHMPNR